MGRLLSVTSAGPIVEEYAYDTAGRRTHELNTRRDITRKTYSYDTEGHLLAAGDATYTYDVDGCQMLTALILLNLAGGDCVEDLKVLQADEGFAASWGLSDARPAPQGAPRKAAPLAQETHAHRALVRNKTPGRLFA